MSAQTELIAKLGEIFQTDRADLDFGIYKILNSRAQEIRDYLERVLPAQIAAALGGNAEHENRVYNHLLDFFSRYYDAGDFISQRRYGGKDRYAVPYNGEEVLLHWANKDQYYTKTLPTTASPCPAAKASCSNSSPPTPPKTTKKTTTKPDYLCLPPRAKPSLTTTAKPCAEPYRPSPFQTTF